MRKSNLVAILMRLDKRDWREFRKFVRSPYFNQREDVIRLFDYLDEALNFLPSIALHRKKVFSKTYPKENFDEKRLRHTTSALLKVLKKYFAHEALEQDTIQTQQYISKSFRKKRLEVFFEKEIAQSRNTLEKGIFRDSKFYFKKYEIGIEESSFSVARRREDTKNLQPISEDLTISFIVNLLRLGCEIQSLQTLSEKNYDLKLLPTILKIIASGEYANTPAIEMYFHCYNSIEFLYNNEIPKSEIHFHSLKNLLQKHWEILPPSEIRNISLYAINYCIKRLNSGERQFIREAFELYRAGLENKTLLEEGNLSFYAYKNITGLGIALSENKWVEDFLERYKEYLHPRERENTWRFNLAYYFFQQKKYTKAMRLLIQVEFKDSLNNFDARRILLKCYFELGEYNALESLLDSFSRYIHRQKDIGYHRENYLNMVRFVKKIINSRLEDKKIVQQLIKEIEATNGLVERTWLLEKLKNTKKTFKK